MKVQLNIEVPDNLKSRVEKVVGRDITDEEFKKFIEAESEYWLGGENDEFDVGFVDSVLNVFE